MINKVHQEKHGNNKFYKQIGKIIIIKIIILTIIEKKVGINSLSGEKNWGKILVGKKFSKLQKIYSLFPNFFFPSKVIVDTFKADICYSRQFF